MSYLLTRQMNQDLARMMKGNGENVKLSDLEASDTLEKFLETYANPTFSFTSRIVSVTMGKRRAAPSPRMLSISCGKARSSL